MVDPLIFASPETKQQRKHAFDYEREIMHQYAKDWKTIAYIQCIA